MKKAFKPWSDDRNATSQKAPQFGLLFLAHSGHLNLGIQPDLFALNDLIWCPASLRAWGRWVQFHVRQSGVWAIWEDAAGWNRSLAAVAMRTFTGWTAACSPLSFIRALASANWLGGCEAATHGCAKSWRWRARIALGVAFQPSIPRPVETFPPSFSITCEAV